MDRPDTITPRTRHLGALLAAAALLVAACEHQPTPVTAPSTPSGTKPGTTTGTPPVFSSQASIGDFQGRLDSGAARVRIRLVPDSLVARRVVIERSGRMRADEVIDGRVVAVAAGATADTLTLDIGGLEVVLDDTTLLRGEHVWGDQDDGDRSGAVLTVFTMRLKAALAAGRRPFVEARRAPPSNPQGPLDSSFVARTIRFDDADEAPEIEVNVDSANFSLNGSPPPAAWITVLGRRIAIRDSTVLKEDLPKAEGVMDFSDTVTAVDTAAHTATLKGGTVLTIVLGSEIETDDGGGLATLADVAAALAASKTVLAHGRGLLVSATPTTFDVIEVVFHLGT